MNLTGFVQLVKLHDTMIEVGKRAELIISYHRIECNRVFKCIPDWERPNANVRFPHITLTFLKHPGVIIKINTNAIFMLILKYPFTMHWVTFCVLNIWFCIPLNYQLNPSECPRVRIIGRVE